MTERFADRYLGDGVLAHFDGYQIWVVLDSDPSVRIALEPEVFESLVKYESDLRRHYAVKP